MMKGMKIKGTLLIAVLLITTLAIAINVSALGTTYYVAKTGHDTFGDGTETYVDVLPVGPGPEDTGPYATITYAISEAGTGDTILVAAGTYMESLTINKGLTLRSVSGALVTTIDAAEADIAVNILSNLGVVTFEGFTVKNFLKQGICHRYTNRVGTTVHVLNNIVLAEPVSLAHGNSIQVSGDDSTVIGNEVTGATLESPDWTGTAILVVAADRVVVRNNYVYEAELGIGVVGYADWGGAAIDNIIEHNTIVDSVTGISAQINAEGTIIRYNDVSGNYVGIESQAIDWDLSSPPIMTPSGTRIYHNNIVDNDYGVVSYVWWSGWTSFMDIYPGTIPVEQVDATLNWWGDPTGPGGVGTGYGDEITDDVDYIPWLDATFDVGEPIEPVMLDKDFYTIDDTVTVTVHDTDANQDSMVLDTVTVKATSNLDIVGDDVTLNETSSDSGIFKGSFTLIGAPPADRDEDQIVVEEDDTIKVTYNVDYVGTATVDMTDPVFTSVEGDLYYRNEDQIELIVVLDDVGYTVTADFSAIDSEYTAAAEDVVPGYTVTYDISMDNTMSDGLYTITVTAEDAAGNTETFDFTTTLDNEAPSVTDAEADPVVIQPEEPTDVTFTASVSDELSGVYSVTIDLDDIGGSATQPMTEITEIIEEEEVGTGVYEFTLVGTNVLAGDYVLLITATDTVDNENALEAITLMVIADLDDPVIVSADVTYPIDKATARTGDTITVTVVATDELTDIASVTIDATELGIVSLIDMAPLIEDSVPVVDTWTVDLEVGTLITAETYELEINATDLAEHTASTLVEVLIQEYATMDMYTVSTDYDSGDTVEFYVSASFAFDLDIGISDPSGFLYTNIDCNLEHWTRVEDYSIVPYEAFFELPSNAVSGTWTWTALEATEELANGNFAVGVTYTGNLSISTAPVDGEVFVDEESWGTAPQSKEVEVGTYTVTFGDMTGYNTPSAEEVTLVADETKDVLGTYVLIPVVPQLVITYTPETVYVNDEVTITVEADEAPVAGVSVYIHDPSEQVQLFRDTNALGTCTFTAYEAGDWVIDASKTDYTDAESVTIPVLEAIPPELPAETTGEETLDSTGAPKTSFALGETINVYSDITNVGTEYKTMLIVVQFKDPDYRAFAPVFITAYLDPGEDFGYAPGLIIPTEGYTTGTWTAKISVFDTWPAQGGVPIGLPVTITFEVTS